MRGVRERCSSGIHPAGLRSRHVGRGASRGDQRAVCTRTADGFGAASIVRARTRAAAPLAGGTLMPGPEAEPAAGRTLIRGAHVITVDDALGSIPDGDVLIAGGHIEDVGRGLDAPGAEVVDARGMICLPGFVDTHRHMWSAMLRGCACCGDLDVYSRDVCGVYGAAFTPEDTYVSSRLGLAEAVDAGITCLHAWEHNIQTPAHADAALAALHESGMRGRFSYGSSNDPDAGSSFVKGTEPVDLEDVLRLQRLECFRPGGLLEIGVALRGPEYTAAAVWLEECAFARDRGLPLTAHTMMTADSVRNVRGVAEYAAHGALGPDLLLIHALQANRDELAQLSATQTPVSIATLSELRYGMGFPPVVEMMRAGVPLSLSLDTMVAGDNSDMFALMRTTMLLERGRYKDPGIYRPEEVLRQATLGGAAALGIAHLTGSLVAGKRADLVLLRATDLNLAPLNAPVAQVVLSAQPQNVDSVWIDGVPRKREGRLLDVDVPARVAAASSAVAGLSARLGRRVT